MARKPERIDLQAIRDRLTVIGLADSFFQSSVLFALAKLRIFELIGERRRHWLSLQAKWAPDRKP